MCAPGETNYGMGAAGLWTMLFIFSKVGGRDESHPLSTAGRRAGRGTAGQTGSPPWCARSSRQMVVVNTFWAGGAPVRVELAPLVRPLDLLRTPALGGGASLPPAPHPTTTLPPAYADTPARPPPRRRCPS